MEPCPRRRSAASSEKSRFGGKDDRAIVDRATRFESISYSCPRESEDEKLDSPEATFATLLLSLSGYSRSRRVSR